MEQAMEILKDKYEFTIRWEPFFLRSDTPPEGRPKPAAYMDPSNPRLQGLIKAGAAVGLIFANKSPIFPSTLKPHALMEFAKEKNDGVYQNDVAEKLFKKYFTDGDILGEETLLGVAEEVGFERSEVNTYLNDKDALEKVFTSALKWSAQGISGVPTFYFNGKQVFSGAQETDTFVKMFDTVNERFPLQTNSKK
ncbi:uncharacterized protein LOC110442998 [Mizuhopecten yessoensis]|uniref:Uncharacterized protein YwbO n=1 Tax=Mizuhopecten yessoensis TaxID=6573 RepID=A0A210R158_MIZYE|nr:uncharacterized protein LOC110442998 [Mizuhopecten yessoensis]OWF54605.1 Uncharacterized protein YwbO [Mizuhopecten yessoensis]